MYFNLIDSLLYEYPEIDHEKHLILSNVKLSTIMEVENNDKAEYVSLPDYLDEMVSSKYYSNYYKSMMGHFHHFNRYAKYWQDMELGNFYISKRLLEFLIDDENLYSIKKFFSMNMETKTDFHKSKKLFDIFIKKFNYLKEGENGYLYYGKNIIRYGKFIKMILEVLHKPTEAFFINIQKQEVEESVDKYKSKFNVSQFKISVLNGRDILCGYNRDYQRNIGETMLRKSCMNDKPTFLDMYAKNKKKIFLLVITDGEGKIVSRNLMWKLKKYNNFLCDRIYANDKHIKEIVIKLAESENWIIYSERGDLYNTNMINKNGEPKPINKKTFSIRLKFRGVKKYPYLDTFKNQRLFSRKLTNKNLKFLFHLYEETDGSREDFLTY